MRSRPSCSRSSRRTSPTSTASGEGMADMHDKAAAETERSEPRSASLTAERQRGGGADRGAAAPSARIDVRRLRDDFPILARTVNGKPLVYLDNAATSQKPRAVLDAIASYYTDINAN